MQCSPVLISTILQEKRIREVESNGVLFMYLICDRHCGAQIDFHVLNVRESGASNGDHLEICFEGEVKELKAKSV